MKILFLTHYFPPEGNAPATRVHAMCRRWVADGHAVTVITGAPNVPNGVVYDGYRNRIRRQKEQIDGISVIRVWTWIAANKGVFLRTANYLSYMCSAIIAGLSTPRPDVLIATSPQFFCGCAGSILSRLRKLPFVLEIRDIWPRSISAVGAIRNRPVIHCLEHRAMRLYRSASLIVTVGEGYKRQLLAAGVPEDRIAVITNGVDRAIFQPHAPSEAVRLRYNPEGKFMCSTVGTIGMASGLDVVLRAAHLLKDRNRNDIAFLVVGDGAVRAELQAQAERNGLNNVRFAGRLDKKDIPDVIAASNACLVHLKRTDLFRTVLPSKIFEAAAMARPIILGVEGEAARLVSDAHAGICIEPENEHHLVAALQKLSSEPETCRNLGIAGQDQIAPLFDHDKLASDYLGLLRNLIS